MKACLLGIVLAVCAAAAHANGIDPSIIIRDPVGCPSHTCVSVPGLTFGFQVPSAGFGVLHFLNTSGVTWTSLIFTETGVAAANISFSCSSNIVSCVLMPLGQNGAKLVLTGLGAGQGIPSGNSFEVILGCVNSNCWPGGLQFEVVANAAVPEPATMALLLTGVGALFTRRKLRAKLAA
jgi:hypothetical protein